MWQLCQQLHQDVPQGNSSESERDSEADSASLSLHSPEQSPDHCSDQPWCCNLPSDLSTQDPHHSNILSSSPGQSSSVEAVDFIVHPISWWKLCIYSFLDNSYFIW